MQGGYLEKNEQGYPLCRDCLSQVKTHLTLPHESLHPARNKEKKKVFQFLFQQLSRGLALHEHFSYRTVLKIDK